jgi:hypothetical protein
MKEYPIIPTPIFLGIVLLLSAFRVASFQAYLKYTKLLVDVNRKMGKWSLGAALEPYRRQERERHAWESRTLGPNFP